MKILQISHRVPWPLNEGGTIGIYNYTKGFSDAGHKVTLLALDAVKHRTNRREAYAELSKYATVSVIPVNTNIRALSAFLNLFTTQSYNVQRFYSNKFNNLIIKTLSKDDFDVIQVEGTFAAVYTDTIFKYAPKSSMVVLRQHNVEYQIWERLATNAKGIKKWYLNLLAGRLKRFEKNHLNQYDLIVPVTPEDGSLFAKLGCNKEIFDSPAGIDTDLWKQSDRAFKPYAYHLGSLEWMPNQEAMHWFIREIWPKIHQKFPELKFFLAGKNMPAAFKQLNIPNIEIVDYVPDAPAFIKDKFINIVPLLSGSGIRLKILEAMSAGKIIISTTIGAQGIQYTNGKELLIADTPDEFVTCFDKIMNNAGLRDKLSNNARLKIENEYSNQAVIERLIQKYSDKLNLKRNL